MLCFAFALVTRLCKPVSWATLELCAPQHPVNLGPEGAGLHLLAERAGAHGVSHQ